MTRAPLMRYLLNAMSPRVLLVLASVGMLGCDSGLPVASFVDKLRVLAVRAAPPEVAPGDTAALSVLAVEPDQPTVAISPLSALWLACSVPAGEASPLPCGLNAGELDTTQALPPACGAQADGSLCLLGSALDGAVTPSASLLDSTGTGTLLLSVVVADTSDGAAACLLATAKNGGLPTEPDRCVISLKRLTVSDPTRAGTSANPVGPPNQNPTLDRLDLADPDGTTRSLLDPTSSVSPVTADKSLTRTLSTLRSDGSAEMKPDGSYEALSVSWFTTGGKLESGRSAFDPPGCASQSECAKTAPVTSASTSWDTPTAAMVAAQAASDGHVRMWSVIRDDRGGAGWLEGSLLVK